MLLGTAARPHEEFVIMVSLRQALVVEEEVEEDQQNIILTLGTKWQKVVLLAEIPKNFWSCISTVQAFGTVLCSSPL